LLLSIAFDKIFSDENQSDHQAIQNLVKTNFVNFEIR